MRRLIRGIAHPRIALALAGATAIAIPAEGLRHWVYRDPAGILTACYGSTRDVQAGVYYPIEECRRRLQADMLDALHTVERCAPGLPWQALAAWGDAVYNIGPRIVCDTESSTAARMLSAGLGAQACLQLPRWDKARVAGVLVSLPGLTSRRAREMDLCLQGYPDFAPPSPSPPSLGARG